MEDSLSSWQHLRSRRPHPPQRRIGTSPWKRIARDRCEQPAMSTIPWTHMQLSWSGVRLSLSFILWSHLWRTRALNRNWNLLCTQFISVTVCYLLLFTGCFSCLKTTTVWTTRNSSQVLAAIRALYGSEGKNWNERWDSSCCVLWQFFFFAREMYLGCLHIILH